MNSDAAGCGLGGDVYFAAAVVFSDGDKSIGTLAFSCCLQVDGSGGGRDVCGIGMGYKFYEDIIAGGRGLGAAEKFEEVIKPLAEVLGGAMGASRRVRPNPQGYSSRSYPGLIGFQGQPPALRWARP